jgi:sugar phosphate isomerase/epimerase
VFNYLAPEERLGSDFYRALADKLNSAGLKCRSAGLRFCYHNHDFEFEPKPGGRPIDTLLARLDRKLIGLEVDTFWVSMAGIDAAVFLQQNAEWVELVHLKDRAPARRSIKTSQRSRTIRFASSGTAICLFVKCSRGFAGRRQALFGGKISAPTQSGVCSNATRTCER